MRRLCRPGRCWRGGCEENLNAETQSSQRENRKSRQKRPGYSPPLRNLTHAQLRASPEQSHRTSWEEERTARDRGYERVGCARIGIGTRGKDGSRISAV